MMKSRSEGKFVGPYISFRSLWMTHSDLGRQSQQVAKGDDAGPTNLHLNLNFIMTPYTSTDLVVSQGNHFAIFHFQLQDISFGEHT